MRILKPLLIVAFVALALSAGVVVAGVAAIVGVLYLAVRAFLPKKASPVGQDPKTSFGPSVPRMPPRSPESNEVIDITATEVPNNR